MNAARKAAGVVSAGGADAATRILDAAHARLVRHGSAALALNDIAVDAGVSKALIHYHFHDKDELLARLVSRVADALLARERGALGAYATQHSPLAVDALWRWIEGELRLGSIRALVALLDYPAEIVRTAAQRAAAARRAQAETTVEQLFTILDLRARIAPPLLARVAVAFMDGLALATPPGDDLDETAVADARVAFDVFWLAMLSLAE